MTNTRATNGAECAVAKGEPLSQNICYHLALIIGVALAWRKNAFA